MTLFKVIRPSTNSYTEVGIDDVHASESAVDVCATKHVSVSVRSHSFDVRVCDSLDFNNVQCRSSMD